MQTQVDHAQAAHKFECHMPNLKQVIERLAAEKDLVSSALGCMPYEKWPSTRCRELCNREQELHTTLDVLRRMTASQLQEIQEPSRE